MSHKNQVHSPYLYHYKNLLPNLMSNDVNLSKKTSKHCSSTYRQRLKRIETNCQLIRQRRRLNLFQILPIEIRSSLFEQRSYRQGSLGRLNLGRQHWQTTNILRLSDEYLYKCKFALYATKSSHLKQTEFFDLLRNLFSYCTNINDQYSNDKTQCHLCNGQFSSNSMFNLHMNRQSLSIDYQCLTCRMQISATNPCQAYYHLLEHRINSNENSITNLNINNDYKKCLNFLNDTFTNYFFQ